MATVIRQERRFHERRRDWAATAPARAEGTKVSWGGIWGGVLVALGSLVLLTALGLAIGVSSVDPTDTSASTLGAGAGIWGTLSLLIALFAGGFAATRMSAITDPTTGFFEGSLVWIVSVLLVAYLASSGIGMLASGAFRVVGGATQALGTVAQSQGIGADIDLSGTVEQIAARLRDPQTAQQLANITGMSVAEIGGTLNEAAQRVESARNNPAQAAEEARRGMTQLMDRARASGALERRAAQLQPQASAAAWITFGALLLSLAAAVLGAMLGRREPAPISAAAAPVGADAWRRDDWRDDR